jgi:ribokinase
MKVQSLIIGDVFLDFSVLVNKLQLPAGGIIHCNNANYTFGGSGNLAQGLSLLGVTNCFVGKAGNDTFGVLYKMDLEKNGTLTRIFLDEAYSTGILISVIDSSAERSFLVARGANDKLNSNEIDKVFDEIECDYLYLTGYSLVNSPQRDALLYAAKKAKAKNSKIFFDVGAFNIIDKSRDYFDQIIGLADILSANFQEACELAGVSNNDEAMGRLSKLAPIVIMRLGREGCMVANDGIKTLISARATNAVDTTGAGDAFNSAFIYGLVNNWSPMQSATFANWFASRKVEQLGARAFPSKGEIQTQLNHMGRSL